MKNIKDLYAAALEEKETLLKNIIELLVFYKKVLKMDDPIESLIKLLTPPPGKEELWNQRYLEALKEMKEERERIKRE
jgi:hypothetical protein